MKRTTAYKVIHNISAVKSKCKEVLVLIKILKSIKKKKRNNMFKLSTIIFFYLKKFLKISISKELKYAFTE